MKKSHQMKKKMVTNAFAMLATLSIGLSNVSMVNAQEAEGIIGNKVTYDLSQVVNNEEEIAIQYWTWNSGTRSSH